MIDLLKSRNEQCTGCGACRNSCPFNAIKMVPDEEGFLVPVIDRALCRNCGLCEKSCPVLQPVYKNNASPACYAMMADDEIRKISSSGGFFTLAARNILEKGGLVFGAAWQENWKVAQVAAANEEELAALRGSKYVQGDSRLSYREAKQALEEGRYVLYTGLPCQIAGLYACLGNKEYEKLITMEVCCHGAPSPAAFEKYLKDEYGDRKIKQIVFRDKETFGWTASMNIHFEDGDKKLIKASEDLYYAGFLPCMIMRKSCAVCKFARVPRQADITAGDYWGLAKVNHADWNDKKGTSFVTLNNARAEAFFRELQPGFKMAEKTKLDDITFINKTMIHPFRAHPGRKHFYSALDLKPYSKLVKDSLEHHYDIGIMGYWYGINYGSVLTYYALYELLRELGKDPVFLPKPNGLWEERFNDPDTIAQKFIWKHCNVLQPFPSMDDYAAANDLCDDFIVGSDVVWNYKFAGSQVGTHFFMDWVCGQKRRISYASSCGSSFYGDPAYNERALMHLDRFDSISVREVNMLELVKKELPEKEVTLVLDPVFMINPQTYEKAIADAREKPQGRYIFSYLLRTHLAPHVLKVLKRIQGDRGFYLCGNPNKNEKAQKDYSHLIMQGIEIEDWLAYIRNCDCYIGDSFHALCFSLIFHRPFAIIFPIVKNHTSIIRFQSLLKLVGLEDRLFSNPADTDAICATLEKEIDWAEVDRRLEELRVKSRNWLIAALEKPYRKRTREEIMVEQLSRELLECRKQIAGLQQQVYGREPWLKPMIKSGIRCLREHGFIYTVKRLFQKIRNKLK